MHLTREEERILAGEEGEAKRVALEAIVRVGEALGAERLVEIKHAHVSGVSYGTIGEAGLRFIENLASMGARVSVPTTVNPVGFDTLEPGVLEEVPGVRLDESFVRGQLAIIRALKRMGASATLTCTPYYLPEVAGAGLRVGDSVAWGESSAIAYANSVLGLRTNREGGPLALLAAVAGRTYYWGMHLEDERVPAVTVAYEGGPLDDARAGVLAAITAPLLEGVPYVKAAFRDEMSLREFLAGLGTAGSIARAVIEGVTPDYRGDPPRESISIGGVDLDRAMEGYAPPGDVEVVFIGCPHARAEDVEHLARLILRSGGKRPGVEVVATLSRREASRLSREAMALVREAGVRIVRDTCLIVSPFGRGKVKPAVATNSFKAYFYLSKRGVPVGIAPIEELARLASRGA